MTADFKQKIDGFLKDLKISLYELHDAATRDFKTGLYNYQFFENSCFFEIERSKRSKKSFSMIAIDIDFFKRLNDTHGHVVGDEALVELSRLIEKALRKYDIPARFGGEEFFVLLPQTDLRRARIVAKRLHACPFKSRLLKKLGVTISLGVTEYKGSDTFKRMLKRCDKALYASKKAGRNTITTV